MKIGNQLKVLLLGLLVLFILSCQPLPIGNICTNECEKTGTAQCVSTQGDDITYEYKVCGNYDSDDCLEWSNINQCASGKICENGECRAIESQEVCQDTDGGKSYYNSGYTAFCSNNVCADPSITDECVSENKLREAYCIPASATSTDSSTYEEYECPYGCVNGACEPAISVVDLEGINVWDGTAVNVKTTITIGTEKNLEFAFGKAIDQIRTKSINIKFASLMKHFGLGAYSDCANIPAANYKIEDFRPMVGGSYYSYNPYRESPDAGGVCIKVEDTPGNPKFAKAGVVKFVDERNSQCYGGLCQRGQLRVIVWSDPEVPVSYTEGEEKKEAVLLAPGQCGNDNCDIDETCLNCVSDCGQCTYGVQGPNQLVPCGFTKRSKSGRFTGISYSSSFTLNYKVGNFDVSEPEDPMKVKINEWVFSDPIVFSDIKKGLYDLAVQRISQEVWRQYNSGNHYLMTPCPKGSNWNVPAASSSLLLGGHGNCVDWSALIVSLIRTLNVAPDRVYSVTYPQEISGWNPGHAVAIYVSDSGERWVINYGKIHRTIRESGYPCGGSDLSKMQWANDYVVHNVQTRPASWNVGDLC